MQKVPKVILAVGLPLAAVAATGAAFAYWTGGGAGNGSATAASAVDALVLAPTSTITGLVPGGTITVPVTAKNNNATTSVAIKTLSYTAGTVTSGDTVCDGVAGATVSTTSPTSEVVVAPAGGTASFGSVHITMANAAVNQDACKGKTFTGTLVAS